MPPQLVTFGIFLLQQLIEHEPEIAAQIKALFIKAEPTADDWNALHGKVAAKSYRDYVPATVLPVADRPAPVSTVPPVATPVSTLPAEGLSLAPDPSSAPGLSLSPDPVTTQPAAASLSTLTAEAVKIRVLPTPTPAAVAPQADKPAEPPTEPVNGSLNAS